MVSQDNEDLMGILNKQTGDYEDGFLDYFENKVSGARVSIFFKHIGWLLCETKDIKQDMHDSQIINRIFNKIKKTKIINKVTHSEKTISDSYYGTIVNCSLMFVRFLNSGDKPKGFGNIANIGKNKQKRDLDEDDMITWDDGLKMAQQTTSVQLKALEMTLLDLSARPSEIIDMTKNSVKKDGDYLKITLRGKTGKRTFLTYNCVPYLLAWINAHPSDDDNAPLWIQEKNTNGVIIKFKYPALKKRIKQLGERAGIKKPLDLYNFRHSGAVIMQLEGVPIQRIAKKMGTSVEHIENTYGRIGTEQEKQIFDSIYGLTKEKKEQIKTEILTCNTCKKKNPPYHMVGDTKVEVDTCLGCNKPLTLAKKEEMEKVDENKIKQIFKEQYKEMIEAKVVANH